MPNSDCLDQRNGGRGRGRGGWREGEREVDGGRGEGMKRYLL